MTGIACPQLGHEVTIKHGLPHLHLLVTVSFAPRSTMVAAHAEATNSRLIEHLVLGTLSIHIWKHIMDA